MWRVAIYAREAPGRAGRRRLDRQLGQLAAQLTRQLRLAACRDLRRPVGGCPGAPAGTGPTAGRRTGLLRCRGRRRLRTDLAQPARTRRDPRPPEFGRRDDGCPAPIGWTTVRQDGCEPRAGRPYRRGGALSRRAMWRRLRRSAVGGGSYESVHRMVRIATRASPGRAARSRREPLSRNARSVSVERAAHPICRWRESGRACRCRGGPALWSRRETDRAGTV